MKNCIRLIGNVVLIMALAFTFMACPDGPDPDPNPNPLGGQVSQPPTDPALAGEFGVYTSGTNLVIKSGTQVYQCPELGVTTIVAELSPYNRSYESLEITINSNKVGTAYLPANGVLGTTAVAVPADSALLTASDLFAYNFGVTLPPGIITEEIADVMIGLLGFDSLNLCAPDVIYQYRDWLGSEIYLYFYSKGNGTMKLPLTQVSPGHFMEVNTQFKTGWNCVAYSTSGNTTTLVSKNPPDDARWVYWGYVAPTLNLQF